MPKTVIDCMINGSWKRISTSGSSTRGYDLVPIETVGGDNWKQTEVAPLLSEPYLNEWGWKCSTDIEREIYRWIYRCIHEGLNVPMRTIEVNDEAITFVTDGKQNGVDEINADIIAKHNYYNAAGKLIPAGERIVNRIISNEYLTYLRIPVVQFGITDEKQLYTITQRVALDNPIEMFPFYPSDLDKVPAIKDANGVCQYIYSCVPVESKRCQAKEIVAEHMDAIASKVDELYGIKQGDMLTVDQKSKVCKVIHDYLILNGNVSGGTVGETIPWALTTPYAVFDRRYQGNCMSYTIAFCMIARSYSVEAISMTGYGYIDSDGTQEGYEKEGDHAWVSVRLSDEEYGAYPTEPSKWSCIDVYWDEPSHGVGTSERKDIKWSYFLDMTEINILEDGEEKTGYSCRYINEEIAYNALPMSGIPSLSMPYSGNEIYIWED